MQSMKQFLGLVKAQQRAWEKRKRGVGIQGSVEPKSFEDWLEGGLQIQERKGAIVELISDKDKNVVQAIKLDWGTHELIREISDFKDEYENEYLPKFKRRIAPRPQL